MMLQSCWKNIYWTLADERKNAKSMDLASLLGFDSLPFQSIFLSITAFILQVVSHVTLPLIGLLIEVYFLTSARLFIIISTLSNFNKT